MISEIKVSCGASVHQDGETLFVDVNPLLLFTMYVMLILVFVFGVWFGRTCEKKEGGDK